MAGIFQCANPTNSWHMDNTFALFDHTPDTQRTELKCFDPTRLLIFCGAANLLTDVIILLLPIPALLNMRVPVSKRLALIGIFSVRIMAVIASSVRMGVTVLWAESPYNSARFGVTLLLWGQVETNAGIISASVPFVRLLFTRKEKQKQVAKPARVGNMSPPKQTGGDQLNQARELPLETWHGEKGGHDTQRGPLITVPRSGSLESRNSTSSEPARPYNSV